MRILIVEDEPVIARRLERMLRELWEERITSLKMLHRLDEARAYLSATPIDVLFLDLNLYGKDGFELLKTAVAGSFQTIIVSAHTDQAIRAFEYGVFDFIGKPFSVERLQTTLDRLDDARHRADYGAKYLSVRKGGGVKLIPVDEVMYIKGAGSYAEIVLRGGARHLHDKSLDRLLALLPPVFERIHRSYLVKMTEVARLTVREGSRYSVLLHSGQELPVGRTRYKDMRAKLESGFSESG